MIILSTGKIINPAEIVSVVHDLVSWRVNFKSGIFTAITNDEYEELKGKLK